MTDRRRTVYIWPLIPTGWNLLSLAVLVLVLKLDPGVSGMPETIVSTDSERGCPRNAYQFKKPQDVEECVGKEKIYERAAVACENTICSKIGREILEKENATAVDATIAVLLCLGVTNPEAAGIGGSISLTIYDRRSKTAHALDGRDAAPAAAEGYKPYLDDPIQHAFGGKAIGVPGTVQALWEAHKKFGGLSWAELFDPSISMLKNGLPLGFNPADALVQRDFFNTSMESDVRKVNSPWRKLFFNEKANRTMQEGEVIKWPALAETYGRLASHTGDDFYTGKLAEDIISELNEEGGFMTMEDLKKYKAKWREVVSTDLGGYQYVSIPPPIGGASNAFLVKILEGYNMTAADLHSGSERLALVYHRFIEASKFAYAEKSITGDQDRAKVMQIVNKWFSKSFLEETRSKIDDFRTFDDATYYLKDAGPQNNKHSTTQISVMDVYGNAVSATASINLHYGSKVLGSKTGIVYNDAMHDFSFVGADDRRNTTENGANVVKAGKRPTGFMAPFLLVDRNGDVRLVGGASGGTKILSTVGQVLMNMLIFDMGLKEAIDYPRIHNQWIPSQIYLNQDFNHKEVFPELIKRGHTIYYYCYIPSGFHGIMTENGRLHAYTDARKHGCPDGF